MQCASEEKAWAGEFKQYFDGVKKGLFFLLTHLDTSAEIYAFSIFQGTIHIFQWVSL